MRITTPIDRPLQDEHVLAVDPDLRPDVSGVWRRRINPFTGRAVSDRALTAEQEARNGIQRLRGQSVTAGVITGLDSCWSRAPGRPQRARRCCSSCRGWRCPGTGRMWSSPARVASRSATCPSMRGPITWTRSPPARRRAAPIPARRCRMRMPRRLPTACSPVCDRHCPAASARSSPRSWPHRRRMICRASRCSWPNRSTPRSWRGPGMAARAIRATTPTMTCNASTAAVWYSRSGRPRCGPWPAVPIMRCRLRVPGGAIG